MRKRPGKTKNYSVSLAPEAQRVLQARARSVHGGNLSAAVAEAAELLRREVALAELARELEEAIGPLSDAARARIDAEWTAAPAKRKRRAA